MAKKKGKKLSMVGGDAVSEYKPQIHIDLDDDDTDQLKNMKIGDKVSVLVTGTVKSISMRKAAEYDKAEDVVGDLSVEIGEITVEDGHNVFAELSDDSDEDDAKD